jgi:DNA-binding NtrC family response regulator
VLEERRFERVGGQKAIEVDVRVVAATNRDLAEMVRRGSFREDLFYRLSVIHIEVPPLRDRLDDVPLLADHFLQRFRHQANRRITGFAPDALAAMTRYLWPGNVRELRNAVERAIVLGDRELIQDSDLPPQVLAQSGYAPRPSTASMQTPEQPRARNRNSPPTPPLGSSITDAKTPHNLPPLPVAVIDMPPHQPGGTGPRPPVAKSLRELEKEGILAALAATGGNKAQAAAILEIDRSTLYKKLKDYDIEG